MGASASSSRRFSSAPAAGVDPRKEKYKLHRIGDHFTSVEQVQGALRRAGVESCNLIVGIDLTKSNEWTGQRSFGGRNLHTISAEHAFHNPYETAVSVIGRTLEGLDDDKLIPFYGFGDSTTTDKRVFSFFPGDQPAHGFQEGLSRYRQIIPHLLLAGPTSFGPIIRQAVRVVRQNGGGYHILLLIADGQVTRSVDAPVNIPSPQERDTIDAIVLASRCALSIVMVGVGDGPFDQMREFDDALHKAGRQFDNFQFVQVDSTAAGRAAVATPHGEAMFALNALMEIPEQYGAIVELGLLGCTDQLPSSLHIPAPSGPPSRCPPPLIGPPQAGAPGPAVGGYAPQQPSAPPPPAAPGGGWAGAGGGGDGAGGGGGGLPPAQQIPEDFYCPITQEVMHDPVIASDGHTYEREAIQRWLQQNRRSPKTGAPMQDVTTLMPNFTLKAAINSCLERVNGGGR